VNTKTKKTGKEIIRYVIVLPVIGTLDFGIYFLLILILPHAVSKAISYIISNGTGYLFNKFWIFKRKKKQAAAPEGGRYVIVDVVLFVVNVATNQAILHFWPQAVFPAIATASLLTALMSFLSKKFWVFKTASI
jgi:putative flippase GtrA